MSETTTGLIGEYLAAAAVLSQTGWAYAPAQQDKIDGVAISKTNNEVYLCQVKTSSLRSDKGSRTPGYHFQLTSGSHKALPHNTKEHCDYDILVLCAAQQRSCLFFHISQIRQFTKRLPPSVFTQEAERDSFVRAIEIAREMGR